MQLRGWTLKSDMDNLLETRTLGPGGGQTTPNFGICLGRDWEPLGFGSEWETVQISWLPPTSTRGHSPS